MIRESRSFRGPAGLKLSGQGSLREWKTLQEHIYDFPPEKQSLRGVEYEIGVELYLICELHGQGLTGSSSQSSSHTGTW